jgi:uncharacterized RDD family membrane protein YckC
VSRREKPVVLPARRVRTPPPVDVALGLAVVTARAASSVLRVALAPTRALLGTQSDRLAEIGRDAAERGRRTIADVAEDAVSSPVVARTLDAALAGPLPEELARSLAERHVIERVLAAPEFQRAVADALSGPEAERALASEELERIVERVASSPAVRVALTNQTASFADELRQGLRRRLGGLDDALSGGVRRRLGRAPAGEGAYGGLIARAFAFSLDLALALAVVSLGGAVLGLVASVFGEIRPQWLVALLLGAASVLAVGAYLLLFWTLTGQTPGMRVLGLRVLDGAGRPPPLRRSLVRLVGLALAIIPLFAGLLPVVSDARRRGLHDRLAGTVVVPDER